MDRRAFVIGGASLMTPTAAPAAGSPLQAYRDRLQARLSDLGGARADVTAQSELLRRHNALRREEGRGPLEPDEELALAARAHAGDLLSRRDFAHVSPEGFTHRERVGLLARRFIGAAGENLVEQEGGAAPTAAELMGRWRQSPTHLQTLLRSVYTHLGVAVLRRGDQTLAAAVFGQRYARLVRAAPAAIRAVDIPGVLAGASAPFSGCSLEPVAPGAASPLRLEAPDEAPVGDYLLRPHAPDAETPRRDLVFFGPIVALRSGEG